MQSEAITTPRDFCFGPPTPVARLLAERRLVPRLNVPMSFLTNAQVLNDLSGDTAIALANILPGLVCGEESAVLVFANEGNRIGTSLHDDAGGTLFRIAAEEEYHEELLNRLQVWLPPVENPTRRRRLARRFFQRMLSRDLGEHFARIAALDSAVCIILAEVCRRGGPIPLGSTAATIFARIRHDEGRHVRFSHRYADALGVTSAVKADSHCLVREGLIHLLHECGDGFEALTIDPDRLWRRLSNAPSSPV